MKARHVHSQLLDNNFAVFFPVAAPSCADLKVADDIPELFIVQRILFSIKAVSVKMTDQGKIRLIGRRVHPAAVFQIV